MARLNLLIISSFLVAIYQAFASSLPKGISFVGRFKDENGKLQANWPGSGIRFSYSTIDPLKPIDLRVSFVDCGTCNFFVSVYHNCEQGEKFNINQSNLTFTYSLKPTGGHKWVEISVIKVTEASFSDATGNFEVESVSIDNGLISPIFKPQCTKGKKLLFIGDSYTCAYGVDQLDPCPFTAGTEDVTHGYAYVVGRMFQADVQSIAWSGKGVVRNYGDANQVSEVPMPAYYNRTLATISSNEDTSNYWDPARYLPDVVAVLLGTNDYSTSPEPTDEQFTSGLINFANQIKRDYPLAKVLLACSPALTVLQCNNIASAAESTGSSYVQIPSNVFARGGYGCSGHPSQLTQQYMAEALQPAIQELLV